MSFSQLGLTAELLRAVSEAGYETATPVQQQAIPHILAGHDIMAGAQTGTGKTAAFTLPLLQRLQVSGGPGQHREVRALVVTPTRELAAQVGESVRNYGKYLGLKSTVIFGGVGIHGQFAQLRRGVDIVIATPGRLLDHARQRTIDLSHIEILVLDEADRMLDMGFLRDIRKLLALLPPQRQNLLFSATFSKEIRHLANDLLDRPTRIQVDRENAAADSVSQVVWPVEKRRKRALLSHMIGASDWQQVLVFTRTKHGANRLTRQLADDGLDAAAIHGNKSQAQRTRALKDFKRGRIRVLVATDIAARGLDIDQLPHVINYELPAVAEDYVHRIGRTGRAGRDGRAIALVCAEETKLLHQIENLLGRKLETEKIPGYETDLDRHANPPRKTRARQQPAGPGGHSRRGRRRGRRAA